MVNNIVVEKKEVKEKIFEIRIVNVSKMPEQFKEEIDRKVAGMTPEDRRKYRGYAKVVYVTASPKRIKEIEPIMGTIVDYYREEMKDMDFSVF